MLDSGLFKYRICCFLQMPVFCFVIILLMTDCSRINDGMIRGRRSVNSIIDRVENIMDDDAELADSLMNLIDEKSINGKQLHARYALFYTAAEYKNYQPVTNDSLIMAAVRFYSINNNLDYRFLSYYYLGCVYLDLGQYSDAGAAFANAEQLSDYIENDHWKGLLYSRLGDVFRKTCDYQRSKDYYIKSEECFKRAGRERHRLYAMLDLGQTNIIMTEFKSADSILQIVEKGSIAIGDTVLYNESLMRRFACLVYLHKPDSAAELLNKKVLIIGSSSKSFKYFETMSQYFIEVKDYAKAESLLDSARRYASTDDDSIYMYYVSCKLARELGQVEKALDNYGEYSSLQNASLRTVLGQPVLAAQNKQYRMMAENELLKYRHARLTLMLCAVIFLFIIMIVLAAFHYKKKHMKEQLYDSMSVAEELSGKIEELKNQVRVQFHERHNISNRLYSMYFDSGNQEKVTKQQLNVTINSLIKDYTSPDSLRKLDKLLNESYDGIMDQLADPEIGLTDKELELFRYSFAGLSSKAVSIITKESPQNIYQIKSRLLKKIRRRSEELWSRLNDIW